MKHLHQTPLKIPLPLRPQNEAPLKTRFFSSECRCGRKPKNEIDHQRYEGGGGEKKKENEEHKKKQKVYLREKKKSGTETALVLTDLSHIIASAQKKFAICICRTIYQAFLHLL